jgi:hypothetical protein
MIPPITDPLGRYWRQPDMTDVQMDATHALLTQAQFEGLSEYSATVPTGVYPGKAWRANIEGVWHLRWYGEHADPAQRDKLCTNNWREILLLKEDEA